MVDDITVPFGVVCHRLLPDRILTQLGIIDRVIVIRVSATLRYAATLSDRVFHIITSEILPEKDRAIGAIRRIGSRNGGA